LAEIPHARFSLLLYVGSCLFLAILFSFFASHPVHCFLFATFSTSKRMDRSSFIPPTITKKLKPDESKLTPLPTVDGSFSGMRRIPTAIRLGQQQHPLSLFERYLAMLRSRQFKILNKDFQNSLKSIKLPSASNTNKGPDHEDYSQVEMVVGQYQMHAKEITTRFGGEMTGNVVTFRLNDMERLGFPNMGKHTFPRHVLANLLDKKIQLVEAGGMHSIALFTNGVPWSWGLNDEDGKIDRQTARS
jgi:hypothetical protein